MQYFQELKKTKIFKDANEFELQAMMFCMKTKFKNFDKQQHIVSPDDKVEDVVLIVKGGAIVQNVDTLGNISVISRLKAGDVYGAELAYTGGTTFKDTVIATEKTLVMFMNKHRLINPCENRCKKHERVVKNLMQVIAENHINLLDKLTHMSKKTIRDKLLSYFNSLSIKNNSAYFDIPFSKTELANYLSVDRSAMSTELSKMKEEGIIDFDKREFHLIKTAE